MDDTEGRRNCGHDIDCDGDDDSGVDDVADDDARMMRR